MIRSHSNKAQIPSDLSLDLAVIILTFNESIHIERAIASVSTIANDILVVDSFSTDDTVARAELAGARVLQHKFVNYSKQFQWGLDEGQVTADWVLRLDADEIVEDDLVEQIKISLPGLKKEIVGVNFNRKHVFMGRWIKHGGRYPLTLLRLWRRNNGRIEDRWMDEHIVVWGGRTITMSGGFSDVNLNDLTFFTDKHNKYATREAIDVLIRRHNLLPIDDAFSSEAVSKQAGIKRFIKVKIYNLLPIWVGPVGYFLYRYILQLGFLDGQPGLIYHCLQGFWYRFLVAAKVREFDELMTDDLNPKEKLALLSAITGLAVSN